MSDTGLEFTRNQKLALCAIAGLTIIGLSVGYGRRCVLPGTGAVVFREAGASAAGANSARPGSDPSRPVTVVFQVAGCVRAPGVYSLPAGKRVMDAVNAAGGAREDADLEAINLAAHIEDGVRIYIPTRDETRPSAAGDRTSGTGQSALRATASDRGCGPGKLRSPGEGVVNINTADRGELQRLPGVGPATAEKIIDYRRQIGRFRSPEQLIDVKGIGPKTFEKMRPFVRV